MNTKVEKLEERVERICGAGNAWIPSWLRTVGSREEIAEWRAIRQAHRGPDYHERTLDLIRRVRKKYPDMPVSFEERMERGVQRLKAYPWLRWREGLHADPVVDKIVAQLSHEEQYHLSKAILAFKKADAAPDAVLTSSLADLPSDQHAVIEKVRRLCRENERGSDVH